MFTWNISTIGTIQMTLQTLINNIKKRYPEYSTQDVLDMELECDLDGYKFGIDDIDIYDGNEADYINVSLKGL